MELLINALHFLSLSVKSFTLQGNPEMHICMVVLNFSIIIVLQKKEAIECVQRASPHAVAVSIIIIRFLLSASQECIW